MYRKAAVALVTALLALGLTAPASATLRSPAPSVGHSSYYVTQGAHVVGGPFQIRGSATLLAAKLTNEGRHNVAVKVVGANGTPPPRVPWLVRSTD